MADPSPTEARTRILDAAEELFAHHGYDATPTAKVAAAAGVPKGLVFYHFARNIDLLIALFDERMPAAVPHEVDDVVRAGDVAGSLLALADRLGLLRAVLPELADLHDVEQSLYHHLDVYGHTIEVLERLIEHINGHDGVEWATFEQIADDFRSRYPFEGSERPPVI